MFTVTIGKMIEQFYGWEEALAYAQKESYFLGAVPAIIKRPDGTTVTVSLG